MESSEYNLIYLLNKGEKKKDIMKIKKINDDIKNIITYEDIKLSFEQFLRDKIIESEKLEKNNEEEFFDINDLNNIVYQYIGYLDGKGWINLEENGIIFLDEQFNLDNLKIMIKATILTKEVIKIQNKIENIQKEIDNITEKLNDIKNNDANYSKTRLFKIYRIWFIN